MKAFKHLIKHALATQHTVSVWDGEEWQLKQSTSYKAIVDAVESVEEAVLRIRDSANGVVASAIARSKILED